MEIVESIRKKACNTGIPLTRFAGIVQTAFSFRANPYAVVRKLIDQHGCRRIGNPSTRTGAVVPFCAGQLAVRILVNRSCLPPKRWGGEEVVVVARVHR